MSRKINSEILSNKQKTTLRSFFNEQNATEFSRIGQISSRLKTSDAEETYSVLRTLYNGSIDAQRKKRNAEKAKERRTRQFGIPITDVKNVVDNWLEKNKTQQFDVQLQGKNGYIHTFQFKAKRHFDNWTDAVSRHEFGSNGGSDPESIAQANNDSFSHVKVVSITPTTGGCNTYDAKNEVLKTNYYEFQLFNPQSFRNDCFFECYKHITKLQIRNGNVRKQIGVPVNTPLTIEQCQKVMDIFGVHIPIISEDVDDVLDDGKYIILTGGKHFKVVESLTALNSNESEKRRGDIYFDFETRETEEFWRTKIADKENRTEKLHLIKDTICCAVYTPYKCDSKRLILTSGEKTSARQFLDFLIKEKSDKRCYNIYAHNGSRFDFYFILGAMTHNELLRCEINMRGTSIIRIKFNGHIFKDTCCFLTDSLSNLSRSFKAEHGKITSMQVHGKQITSAELCFYRQELKHSQFMQLEQTDPEFWSVYVNYCMYDCLALQEIWKKFSSAVENLLECIFPRMRGLAPLSSAMTIGSHAKRIADVLNTNNRIPNSYKRAIEQFAGIDFVKVDGKSQIKCDMQKYEFLCNFKRGGISHCNKPGRHNNGITGIDIASQYPASMMNAMLPCGRSEWTTDYDETAHGFYLLKNVAFSVSGFKPCALSNKGESLKWDCGIMPHLYLDSYTLKYAIQHYGISFEVEKGLISYSELESSKLFGKFINTFYEQKKQQDFYKDTGDSRYNEALRSTCKLYLNSLSGKLVENPSNHFSMVFSDKSKTLLNGVGVEKSFNEDKYNSWIVAGLMVYSYSKRLLFEYIHCLPNKHDDVIHVETDGIYFDTRNLDQFNSNLENYSGDFACVKYGSELGNIKLEKSTTSENVAYFLGKKTYCITLPDNKNIYRCKGAPVKAIDINGKEKVLIDTNFYSELYNGNAQTLSWAALKKELFREQTRISSYEMIRTIQPMFSNYTDYK